MLQKITSTDFNRYPGIFRTVAAMMLARHGIGMNGSRLRILSFGCSEGQEMQSIRSYFPEAWIFGCDVDISVLRKSRKRLAGDRFAHVFLSNEQNIAANGPFDIIFAMSVFCQYPESKKHDNLSEIYPFSRFESLAEVLCQNMIPGGVFCLMNSNYLFRQTRMGVNFRAIRSPLQAGNGFIDKFDRTGDRLTTSFGHKPKYSHRREASGIEDHDLIDSMYQYLPEGSEGESAHAPSTGAAPEGFEGKGEEVQLFGECLETAISEKRAAMSLIARYGVDAQGDCWVRNHWRRSTLDGQLMEMEPFWSMIDEGHALQRNRFSNQIAELEDHLSSSRGFSKSLKAMKRRLFRFGKRVD
jgi:hypothetical protein